MSLYLDFISCYKELESLLSVSVREYEDTLSESDSQKLRLCRQFRNYIQHNDDNTFLIVSEDMLSFLKKIVYQIKIRDGIAKEKMVSIKKYGCVLLTDTLSDIALLLKKKNLKEVPVFDDKNQYIGFISKEMISDYFALGSLTKATKLQKYKDNLLLRNVYTTAEDTPMMDVMQHLHQHPEVQYVFVLNKKGIVSGIISFPWSD